MLRPVCWRQVTGQAEMSYSDTLNRTQCGEAVGLQKLASTTRNEAYEDGSLDPGPLLVAASSAGNI